jgi:hypothetical protein
MAFYRGPKIVTNGLVLALDAANTKSYVSGSTTWRDLSGNGNNATLVATGSTAVSASFNSNFGGIIQFNTGSSAVLLRPVQDDFSLCCWFRTNQVASASGFPQWYGGMGLVDCEVANVVDDFGTSIGAGKVLFGTGRNTPSTDLTITSSLTYNDNIWHHVVATRVRSTGTITLYVDAQQVATGTSGVQSLTSSTNMRIGAIQVNNNFFSGSIANVQIYNRALSAAEVAQNYNAVQSRFNLT